MMLYYHLTQKQFPFDYIRWVWHGECNTLIALSSMTNVIENVETFQN